VGCVAAVLLVAGVVLVTLGPNENGDDVAPLDAALAPKLNVGLPGAVAEELAVALEAAGAPKENFDADVDATGAEDATPFVVVPVAPNEKTGLEDDAPAGAAEPAVDCCPNARPDVAGVGTGLEALLNRDAPVLGAAFVPKLNADLISGGPAGVVVLALVPNAKPLVGGVLAGVVLMGEAPELAGVDGAAAFRLPNTEPLGVPAGVVLAPNTDVLAGVFGNEFWPNADFEAGVAVTSFTVEGDVPKVNFGASAAVVVVEAVPVLKAKGVAGLEASDAGGWIVAGAAGGLGVTPKLNFTGAILLEDAVAAAPAAAGAGAADAPNVNGEELEAAGCEEAAGVDATVLFPPKAPIRDKSEGAAGAETVAAAAALGLSSNFFAASTAGAAKLKLGFAGCEALG
jgi:hypothetical protein